MSENRPSYSDEELEEFRQLILEKLKVAEYDFNYLRESAIFSGNDVSDTNPTFKALQDSSANMLRAENGLMAERLLKFIKGLQAALVRIENKTYGVCRVTGKLIPKERLRAVPHATLSIEAKLSEQNKG